MLGFNKIAERFPVKTLIRVAGCFFVVRSFLFVAANSVLSINLTQISQGVSFALFIPAVVYYVNREMEEADKIKRVSPVNGRHDPGASVRKPTRWLDPTTLPRFNHRFKRCHFRNDWVFVALGAREG